MKSIKYFQFRQKLNLPFQLPKELKFRIARTEQDYLESSRILYDCYREKGYTEVNSNGMRMTPYHLLPSTTVLLALWNNEIIGTISLIRDNPIGLPLEAIFDVGELRANHSVLCEASSLAIKREFRGKAGEIFHPMVRYMWNYALSYFGVDYLVIAINPSMFELYESVYLFEPLKEAPRVDSYDFANNNPAVGEYINLKTSFQKFKKKYDGVPNFKNLYTFMTQDQSENSIFPSRRYFTHRDAPVTLNWLSKLGQYVSERQLKPVILDGIAKSFGYKNYEESCRLSSSGRQRIPVSFEVLNFPGSKVVDISEKGLKIARSCRAQPGSTILLNCQISSGQQAKVLVEPVWDNSQHVTGYRVVDCSEAWLKMIQETVESTSPITLKKTAA